MSLDLGSLNNFLESLSPFELNVAMNYPQFHMEPTIVSRTIEVRPDYYGKKESSHIVHLYKNSNNEFYMVFKFFFIEKDNDELDHYLFYQFKTFGKRDNEILDNMTPRFLKLYVEQKIIEISRVFNIDLSRSKYGDERQIIIKIPNENYIVKWSDIHEIYNG